MKPVSYLEGVARQNPVVEMCDTPPAKAAGIA
jgi:hypothetical protein